MLGLIGYFAQLVLVIGSAGFAFAVGHAPERRGALWLIVNYVVDTALVAGGWKSPTLSLVLDGIYATGFLPLAIIYVSWWAGALALLAAGIFSLEAAYLMQDRAIDGLYNVINDSVTLAIALTFLACGIVSLRNRRNEAAAERQAGFAAAPT